jgi:hypothetical protein
VNEPAETLHVAFTGCDQDGAGAEEQQAFEQGVIEDVQQGGRECERCGELHALRPEGERQAKADEDETWLGAAGCASGSQACSGTMPALEPAPISARIKASAPIVAEGCAVRICSNA